MKPKKVALKNPAILSADHALFARRDLIALALAPGFAPVACADGWAFKPITRVALFFAGGTTDIVSRVVAQHLSISLGQKAIVDNLVRAAVSTSTKDESATKLARSINSLVS